MIYHDSIGFSEKTILDTNEEIVFYFVEEQEGEKYLRLKFLILGQLSGNSSEVCVSLFRRSLRGRGQSDSLHCNKSEAKKGPDDCQDPSPWKRLQGET